jgi:SagB-type dehydrogenase family enzyme
VEAWRKYHESTKHSPESLARLRHVLDWANMPDPFRHYDGVPVLDLPADPAHAPAGDGSTLLSQLLFYSAAISASKRVPSTGEKYALRVNPSSGNLHPTEFHFMTRGLAEWPDGLYHYRPSSHMAEQRATGDFTALLNGDPAPIVFVLTSIAWREAWKYQDRAYRYCLLDLGHAWEALTLSARALGWRSTATAHFSDDQLARRCGLPNDEWPMLLVSLTGPLLTLRDRETQTAGPPGGRPNQLSLHSIAYPSIENIHAATKLAGEFIQNAEPARSGSGEIVPPPPASPAKAFGEAARGRRSALDFEGGPASMSLAQLSAILAATAPPLVADFASSRLVQLYLYAHRIDGLPAGVYRYWPERGELELTLAGDQRVYAAALSLRQNLAGNSCVSFSMIGDLERATRAHGDRGYRYVHFEAGVIGQRLYLAAETLGLRATGIGAFFDDLVHRHLGLDSNQGQVVYHFAIGYPVADARLEA